MGQRNYKVKAFASDVVFSVEEPLTSAPKLLEEIRKYGCGWHRRTQVVLWVKPQSLGLADQKVGGSNPRDGVSSRRSVPAPANLPDEGLVSPSPPHCAAVNQAGVPLAKARRDSPASLPAKIPAASKRLQLPRRRASPLRRAASPLSGPRLPARAGKQPEGRARDGGPPRSRAGSAEQGGEIPPESLADGARPSAPVAAAAGSTMEAYEGLTDKELIARLKKYSIPHGPLVGSTRKLYEKKVYEYETERRKRPSPGKGSLSTEPSTSESYIRETFVSPQSRPNLNYGREALGSTRTYITENYDSPGSKEYYSEYINEDSSPTRSYLSENYRLPRHEGRSTYATEDLDANSSETSTSSYQSYVSSLTSGARPEAPSARQPIAEPYPYNSSRKDVPSVRDSSSYQSIFYRKSPGLSTLGVEPRRAIHPERQTQAAEGATGTKRYLPLWPQLFLFVLLAGFLAFIYFFLQGGADDNPFVKFLQQ
ncbi:emerin isoform X3 [Podarcis muralis]